MTQTQPPVNRAGLFARNARIPSCPSADRAASAMARASISICDSSVSLSLRSIADMGTKDQVQDKRSNSIRVLRYGVKSRAYGVN